MQSISSAFTRAAADHTASSPGIIVFWLMVWAIAILDDADRREEERRKKHNRLQPQRKPECPPGRRGPGHIARLNTGILRRFSTSRTALWESRCFGE